MSELFLEEGKFYINRKGEKVGPVERDLREVGTTFEWSDGRTMWRTDGREYNLYESEYDLIEEWKEEPVTKFNVGDKVKATTPEIVCDVFKDKVGVITQIWTPCDRTGEQVVVIEYGDNYQQTAYVLQDGVVLVEEAKGLQEDDEWGPWTCDYKNYMSPNAHVIVEFAGSDYLRHKVKKPVVKKQIEVGVSYVNRRGVVYNCIYLDGDRAWMKSSNTGPAYVWTLDGESISLNSDYNIDFTISPSDYNEVPL